jgi:hypothetical protein
LQKKVTKNGLALEPDTVLFAGYVLVFTTLSEVQFEPQTILDWYRLRWQIELVFKRFKQIAQLGHLPKNDPQSARAWLYGKLFVALLVEKLLAHANSVPPGGIHFKSNAPRSRWREFAFILHQIQRAVENGLSLAGAIGHWPRLARGLSESSRLKHIITKQVSAYGVNPGLSYLEPSGRMIGTTRTDPWDVLLLVFGWVPR